MIVKRILPLPRARTLSSTDRARKTESSPSPNGRLTFSTTGARALRALLLILVGLTVTMGSASSDAYLHRGTSQDNSIIYRQPTGRGLATNVDLRAQSDADLNASTRLLSDAGYRFARQEFSSAHFEPTPGNFDWAEYHRIVDALTAAGIDVVVVLVDTPDWARAPATVGFPDAPPLLTEKYEQMCAALRAEFPGLHLFQIGQNLDDPEFWGGKELQAITYRAILTAAARGLDIAATDSTLITGEVGLNPEIRRAGETSRYSNESCAIRGSAGWFASSAWPPMAEGNRRMTGAPRSTQPTSRVSF